MVLINRKQRKAGHAAASPAIYELYGASGERNGEKYLIDERGGRSRKAAQTRTILRMSLNEYR